MALPNLFGQLQVAPLLPEFMHRPPGIELELSFMDRYVDLIHEGFDVAIRIGTLTDSKPEDLAHQACLHFSFFADGETWTLRRGEERVAVRVRPVLRSDNAEALRLAAVGGCGIAFLATFLVGEDLRAGRLVRLLDGWSVPDAGVFAVHPPGRLVPSKVRAFVSFLAEHFAGTPPWERAITQARLG